MAIKNSLASARTLGGGASQSGKSPTQYGDRSKRYFTKQSRAFGSVMAKYASDFIVAQVQGLDPDEPYQWSTTRIRAADLIRPTASLTRDFDDYKQIYFADEEIEYLQPGSKLQFMGSTWLATNPANISNAMSAGIVQRCNAAWNYRDEYGVLHSEPFCVENRRADSNVPDAQSVVEISRGYFNVTCQYNPVTARLRNNTRIILGTGAYRIAGLTDFFQEFTGDYASVRLLRFTARFEEPNDALDDMENHVAGGKADVYDLQIDGGGTVAAGKVLMLIPSFTHNGKPVSGSYTWTSSNPSVASVSSFGIVTGVSEGACEITATLDQNPDISESVEVRVTNAAGDTVWFTNSFPFSLRPFQTLTVTAGCAEPDGSPAIGNVSFTFTGADEKSCRYEVDGNTAIITVYAASDEPLLIAASYGGQTVEEPVILAGI